MNKNATFLFRLLAEGGEKVRAVFQGIGAGGQKAMTQLGEATAKANRHLEGLSRINGVFNLLKNSWAGLIAAISAGGIAAATRSAYEWGATLRQAALSAGTTTESLQELEYAASTVGIASERMVGSLNEMTSRAKEFADTGGGPAADAFKALGLSQQEVLELSQDSAALFNVLIDRMRETGDTAASIRLADMFFGGSGEDIVRLADNTGRALGDLRAEARALGVVMSDDMARSAEEADRKLDAVAFTLKARLQIALVGSAESAAKLADTIQDKIPGAISLLERMAGAFKGFGSDTQDGLRGTRIELERLAELAGNPSVQSTLAHASVGNIDVNATLAERMGSASRPAGGTSAPSRPAKTASASGSRLRIGQSADEKSAAKDLDRQREKVDALTEAMQAEIAATRQSEKEQYILSQTRRAGAEVTDEQRVQIRELASELYDEQQAVERVDRATSTLANTFDNALDSALSGNLSTWEDWGSAVTDIVGDVVKAMWELQTGSSGSGLSTVIAGSIIDAFGGGASSAASSSGAVLMPMRKPTGGRATGGRVYAGDLTRVNEMGDEYLVTPLGGSVVPAGRLGGGGDLNVVINNYGGAEISATEGRDGDLRTLTIMVDQATAANIQNPRSKTNKALRASSGDQALRRR